MRSDLLTGVALLALGVLTACSTSTGTTTSRDCVSRYEPVAHARSWAALREAMVRQEEWGPVASVRTRARGHDVGAGDQDVVLVVDLLDGRGRRLAQADVWRTDDGGWRAGVWSQCID